MHTDLPDYCVHCWLKIPFFFMFWKTSLFVKNTVSQPLVVGTEKPLQMIQGESGPNKSNWFRKNN